MVLREVDLPQLSRKFLLEAVNANPLNWSAWIDLATLSQDVESV